MGKKGDKASGSKKKTRGPSTGKSFEEMLKSINDEGNEEEKGKKETLYIDFNNLGLPYGRWLKKFRSDLGKMAQNIRIIRCWAEVTNGEKNTIWKCAKKTWKLEDERKKYVLRVVRNRFRDWKTRMANTYIFPKEKTDDGEDEPIIESPVGKYKQLTKEDWEEFVKQRMSPEFQEIRKKAQDAQKQNVHVHFVGRAGYVGKQQKWFEEELQKEKESQPKADPSAIETAVVERLSDRGYQWIKAHTPPSTAPPPSELQNVINKYGVWKQKQDKGEFVPSGFEDALVKALGKPEHKGRVRGVGGSVGLQAYFGKSIRENNGKRYTDDDIKLLIEKAKSDAMEEMNLRMEKKIAEALSSNGSKKLLSDATMENLPKNNDRSPNDHVLSSCHSTHLSDPDPFIELKETVPCRLAVLQHREEVVVADGMVSPWVEGRMVHNRPLTMENAHVSIDRVKKPEAELPCPWNGFSKVGEVEGSFAQWPKTLILLGDENEVSKVEKKRKRKLNSKDTKESASRVRKKPTSLQKDDQGKSQVGGVEGNDNVISQVGRGEEDNIGNSQQVGGDEENDRAPLTAEELTDLSFHCKILEEQLCSMSTTACIKIIIDPSVFNYGDNKPVECFLTVVEIRQMFRYLWLNVVVLQAWGSFLYQCASTIKVTKLVGFLCPVKLVDYMHNPKQCEAYIAHAMKIQDDKKYIMGAFYEANHWMLLVICVGLNTMYIFDSQQRTPKKLGIKKASLEGAWLLYCAFGGRRSFTKSSKLSIKLIKCPQQPDDYECGYYVMKWMYDVIFKYAKTEEKDFEQNISKSTMSISEMNVAREVWATKCLDNLD